MTKTERRKIFKKYNKRLYDLKRKNMNTYDYLVDKITGIEGISLTDSGYISAKSELDDLALRAINSIVETSKEAIKSYKKSISFLTKKYKTRLDDFYPENWEEISHSARTAYRAKRSTNTQSFLHKYGKAIYKKDFDKAQELLEEYYSDL